MKTTTKSLMGAAFILGSALMLNSCSKTVTPKKLDGEWDVTSGEITSSTSYTNNGVTTTYTSNSSFNGSSLTTSMTEDGVTTSTSESMTIMYTFDKKTGEYSSETVMTDPTYNESYNILVYDDKDGNYDYTDPVYVDMVISRQSTTKASGLYTVTGDAGDEIEANSQITFQERSNEESYTDTYIYYKEGTETPADVSKGYMYDYNSGDYVKFPTSATGTETETGQENYAEVWNVTELKKGEMQVNQLSESKYSDSESSSSSSYKTEVSWTLTQR